MVVKEIVVLNPPDGLKYWVEYKGDNKKKDLLTKANDFAMALIYLNDCLSNEMRIVLAKNFWIGDDWYPHSLEKMCNLHQTLYGKSQFKERSPKPVL